MLREHLIPVAAAMFLTASAGIAIADTDPVRTRFTYQGRLPQSGEPVNAEVDLTFRLYDAATDGNLLGSLTAEDVLPGDDGTITVDLDFGSVFTGAARWLEIIVNGEILAPRQPLMPAPYAMVATTAANVPTKAVIGSYAGITGVGTLDSLNVSGNVGIGTTSPSAKLHVITGGLAIRGERNTGTGSFPGVHGESNSVSGNASGVRGYVSAESPASSSAGVWGRNLGTNNNGYGVRGTHDGGGSGVFGTSVSGIGVEGVGTPGVFGRAASQSTYGGFFVGSGDFGTGNSLLSIGESHLISNVGIGTTSPDFKLHVIGGSDTSPTGGGYLVLGPSSGVNLSVDNNEIMARENGAVATLHLNADGGQVRIGQNSGGTGLLQTPVLQITGGSDLSERFDVASIGHQPPVPGMVVCIDPANPGRLVPSSRAYDRTVAGIISGANGIKTGMMMGQEGSEADGAYPVALTGRVYVMVDATSGAILPGDLMTTSDVPGHAMKVEDYEQARGAIIGKAMTAIEAGERGMVLVLVTLQ